MRNLLFLALSITALLLPVTTLQAHQFSTASLTLEQTSKTSHHGFLAVSVSDLHQKLALDPTQDGQLTWSELVTNHHQIILYLSNHLQFSSQGKSCTLNFSSELSLLNSYGETQLKQPIDLECPLPVTLSYSALFDSSSDHKLLVNWQLIHGQTQTIIDEPTESWQATASTQSAWDTLLFYLYQGMIHIWIGLDHVLFVLTLLLHFVNKPAHSHPVSNQSLNLKSMIWLITGFTIAHSITLTFTALDWIAVSSKWAEVGIAISVAYCALNVITHWVKYLMIMTVAFGLLHGLGFAGALNELGLSKNHQLVSILGFNLGVEIGQIVIILAAIPFLWLLKQQEALRKIAVPAMALAIFLLGMLWIWQRV